MRIRQRGRRRPWALPFASVMAVAAVSLSCGDATDIERLEIVGTGVLFGQAFLDLDGDGVPGAGDEPIEGAEVLLVTGTGGEVVQLATTDSIGAFTLFEVPVGTYRLALDTAAVGDSLEVLGDNALVPIELGDTTRIDLGVTYPTRTIEEIASEPLGRRVFTSGIALNSRVNFDAEGRVHVLGASGFLRALNVERSAVTTGDSVRLLGTVVEDNGRPALDPATPEVLIAGAALVVPQSVTLAAAADASGGTLDAALVRLSDVFVTDTVTDADGDFHFVVFDAGDSVEVVVREFLAYPTEILRPDTVVWLSQLSGLLDPVADGAGGVRWRVLPRAPSDLDPEIRIVDLSVTLDLDADSASLGDTVTATVVLTNGGPLDATAFEVRDTIPTAVTYLSSTATAGTYDPGSGLWSLPGLGFGDTDTLRLVVELADTSVANVPFFVEALSLALEVDSNPFNDDASRVLDVRR